MFVRGKTITKGAIILCFKTLLYVGDRWCRKPPPLLTDAAQTDMMASSMPLVNQLSPLSKMHDSLVV